MKIKLVVLIVGLLAVVLMVPSSYGQIHTTMEGSLPGLKMSFEFMSLPKPLSVATIQYTVEVRRASERDILIGIAHGKRSTRMLSDTIITLPGPLKVGDMFSGNIDIVPLMAGSWCISPYRVPWMANADEIHIQWCLDEDGELHYLGNSKNQPVVVGDPPSHIPIPEPVIFEDPDGRRSLPYHAPVYNPSSCSVMKTTFFAGDSAVLLGKPAGPSILQWTIRVNPLFRMGDTSTITYRLKMLADVPDGLDLTIEATGFLVVDTPEVIDYPLVKDQVVEASMRVVSLEVGQISSLVILCLGQRVSDGQRSADRIWLQAIFYEDGTLRYLTDEFFEVVDSTKLPQSFPPIDRAKHIQRIVIKSED